MSSAATLKAGSKRGFDEMAVDVPAGGPCSPRRVRLLAPACKRARGVSPVLSCGVAAAAAGDAAFGHGLSGVSAGASSSASGSSPALYVDAHERQSGHRPFSKEEVSSLGQHVPRRLKRTAEKVAAGHVSVTEKLFSVVDVRDIVESVVAEREAKLREEYQLLLQDRLAQQFRDFTKFNEDHLHRNLKGRDCAYLS